MKRVCNLFKKTDFNYWKLFAYIFAIILFSLNFIRIFDNNFWGDEAFSINLVKHNVLEIIYRTSKDVHPPLYYLILKIFYEMFGNEGWVYHLCSLVPYGIIMILSLTAIWKKFGKETSIILMMLASLSPNAVEYNVEVRMYSWGALFILLSYYELYMILIEGRNRDYILFTVFSLAAAYTHYYCLISVAFFYITLIILAFLKKVDEKKVLIVCITMIVLYLPWFLILLNAVKSVFGDFWIPDIFNFGQCIEYLFSNHLNQVLIILILIVAICYEINLLKNNKNGMFNQITINWSDIKITKLIVWILTGVFTIIGTIGIGIFISYIVRPIFITRYIYPVSIVAWLLLGICISKLKFSKIYVVLLIVSMLVSFTPKYINKYRIEKKSNNGLEITLAETVNKICKDDIIFSNRSGIPWSIAEYYYPGVKSWIIGSSKIPQLDGELCYWFFLSPKRGIEKIFNQIDEQGFICESIINKGVLGTIPIGIYKVFKNS